MVGPATAVSDSSIPPDVEGDGEIYSGDIENDDTLERLEPNGITEWSVMRAGWERYLLQDQNETNYYVYSIEELLTVDI
jgi:hypothetical protein